MRPDYDRDHSRTAAMAAVNPNVTDAHTRLNISIPDAANLPKPDARQKNTAPARRLIQQSFNDKRQIGRNTNFTNCFGVSGHLDNNTTALHTLAHCRCGEMVGALGLDPNAARRED